MIENFVSLGDNCELGLIQRKLGFEPNPLFAFARSEISSVLRAINESFKDIDNHKSYHVMHVGDEASPNYMIEHRHYNFTIESRVKVADAKEDEFKSRQIAKLVEHARSFVETLRADSRIYVIKSNGGVPFSEAINLRKAIDNGKNSLLLIETTAEAAEIGRVTKLSDRFFVAKIDAFATYEKAHESNAEAWLAIMERTHLLHQKTLTGHEGEAFSKIYDDYRTFLRRMPDRGGIEYFSSQKTPNIADDLLSSTEFAAKFPGLHRDLSLEQKRCYLSLCNSNNVSDVNSVAKILHPIVISNISGDPSIVLPPIPATANVIFSLTSLGRPSLIMSLNSLLEQKFTDGRPMRYKIVLNLPLGVVLPQEVSEFLQDRQNIVVRRTNDWGPITKIIETLKYDSDPETVIVVADDDVVYPTNHFGELLQYFFAFGQRVAVAPSGFRWRGEVRNSSSRTFVADSYEPVEGHLEEFHVIETWCGVVLKRSWFNDEFIELAEQQSITNPDLMRQDDIFYSTYLDSIAVPKININSKVCNRYNSGFDAETQSEISKSNMDMPTLNGQSGVNLNWVRFAEYSIEMQTNIFRHCVERKAHRQKILFLTMCIGKDYQNRMYAGMKSKLSYCHRYGFDFRSIDESLNQGLPIIWSKMLAIRDALDEGYDYVFYTDADVVITNPAINFEKVIDTLIRDIACTEDLNGVNIGTILVRNTDKSREFINYICNMKEFWWRAPWYEQAAFVVALRNNRRFADLVQILPQRTLNSYVYNWHHNDFLVHLAGVYGPIASDVLSALYKIVYHDMQVNIDALENIRSFLSSMSEDPNREDHLIPRPTSASGDVYISANNSDKNKATLVVLAGNSLELVTTLLSLYSCEAKCLVTPSFSAKELAVSPGKLVRYVKRLSSLLNSPFGNVIIVSFDAPTRLRDIPYDQLREHFELRVLDCVSEASRIGDTSQTSLDIGVLTDAAAQRTMILSEASFSTDTEGSLRRISLFTGTNNLEYQAENALQAENPGSYCGRPVLSLLLKRSGAAVNRHSPFQDFGRYKLN